MSKEEILQKNIDYSERCFQDINKARIPSMIRGIESSEKIRKIIDFKIYMSISDNLIVKRRLKKFGKKDKQEWYSKNVVIKFYRKYGEPKKAYVDLILNGEKNINDNLKKILKSLSKLK